MNEYITTGISNFEIARFVSPINRPCFNKPYGGLWGCHYDPQYDISGQCASSWINWCNDENFNTETLDKGIIYSLKEEARIYTIDTYSDLEAIINKYPYRDKTLNIDGLFSPTIDFKAIQQEYDVIELTDAGQWATRLSHPYSLYGWDVSCSLILNPDVIINIRPWKQ